MRLLPTTICKSRFQALEMRFIYTNSIYRICIVYVNRVFRHQKYDLYTLIVYIVYMYTICKSRFQALEIRFIYTNSIYRICILYVNRVFRHQKCDFVALEFKCSICFLWLSHAIKSLTYKYFTRMKSFFLHDRQQKILIQNKYVLLYFPGFYTQS